MTREDINDIIKTICPNDEDFEKACISPAYLKKELEALAVEQEPRWILVSERLPENKQVVLFCTTQRTIHQGVFFDDSNLNRWYSQLLREFLNNSNVVAWQPLSEPFRAESEG